MTADERTRTLRIERTFSAPADAVFDAWTSPETLRRWWPAGPYPAWSTPIADIELRVGGRIRLVMRDPDGAEIGGFGEYIEIRRPTRLVFSWRWEGVELDPEPQLIEVTFFSNADGSTAVVLLNRRLSEPELGPHAGGWQTSFDNLDVVLREEAWRQ